MWSFNATLDRDVPCASERCQSPCDSDVRAKECTGIVPAWEPHYHRFAHIKRADPDAGRYCRFCVRAMNDILSGEDPILVRAELVYSDGARCVLENDAADDWGREIGSAGILSRPAHGAPSCLPWRTERMTPVTRTRKDAFYIVFTLVLLMGLALLACTTPREKGFLRRSGAERWAKLTPPDRDSYHYLEGQPISCGAALELQRTEVRSDDYGDYTFYLPDGVRVRFEIAHGPGGTRTPVLYANVGGFSFTSDVEPGMRFRWPRGGR